MPVENDLNSREDYQIATRSATQEAIEDSRSNGADRNVAAPPDRGAHLEFVNRSIREWIATKVPPLSSDKGFLPDRKLLGSCKGKSLQRLLI
jgi:hypothetical protein